MGDGQGRVVRHGECSSDHPKIQDKTTEWEVSKQALQNSDNIDGKE